RFIYTRSNALLYVLGLTSAGATCDGVYFFLTRYGDRPHLHSFPTRRSSDLAGADHARGQGARRTRDPHSGHLQRVPDPDRSRHADRKSTRLNSSHVAISYAVFCLKKKNTETLLK